MGPLRRLRDILAEGTGGSGQPWGWDPGEGPRRGQQAMRQDGGSGAGHSPDTLRCAGAVARGPSPAPTDIQGVHQGTSGAGRRQG